MMTSPTIRVGPFRWQCSAPGSSGAVSRSGPCRRISLASRLPSPPSALSVLSLFGSFVGAMHLLDSLPPCMKSLPLRVPLPARCPAALGQWQGLSVLARPEGTRFLCMRGVFDSAGSAAHSRFLCTAVWPSDGLTPWASWITVFGAQYPAYRYPCPTLQFKCSLATALAWLGARAARYSFPVRLLHSLLHAGLSRRYPRPGVCPTNSATFPMLEN